jgi:hypothetical protein
VNFPEPKPAESPERKALLELKHAHLSLRTMFHLLALCSLLLTGTIFVILFQQVSLLRRQMEDTAMVANDYNNVFIPQLEAVRTNLQAFARTNQSLDPILRKYFSTNSLLRPVTNAPANANR